MWRELGIIEVVPGGVYKANGRKTRKRQGLKALLELAAKQ